MGILHNLTQSGPAAAAAAAPYYLHHSRLFLRDGHPAQSDTIRLEKDAVGRVKVKTRGEFKNTHVQVRCGDWSRWWVLPRAEMMMSWREVIKSD